MFVDEQVYLDHAGVKGMKWGVRRQRRVEALQRGGTRLKEGGKIASRVRAAGSIGPVDFVRGRGVRGGAARKAVRVQGQLDRKAAGKATVMDNIKRYGSTRLADLIPMREAKINVKRTARRDIVPAALVVAGGALYVSRIIANSKAIRQNLA